MLYFVSMSGLLVVDGFSLAFRAFYAFPLSLTLSDGQPINAVYGFMSLLLQAIDQLEPEYVVVCFDRPEATFRKETYDLYKANRSEAPDEFKTQVDLLKSAAKRAGIFCLEKAGLEADDLMGWCAQCASLEGIRTNLYTSDQDAFQLVNDMVSVVAARKGHKELIRYDRAGVFNKCGVYPEQIVDFKALKGDSSDNIPGVKGVGDKTAAKLILQFSSLDNIYANLTQVASKSLREKLHIAKDDAYLSKFLATIKCDLDIDSQCSDWTSQLDWVELKLLFEEYQFNNLLKKYDRFFITDSSALFEKDDTTLTQFETIIISDLEQLKQFSTQLNQGFTFDLETSSLVVQDAQIIGISLCVSDKEAYYVPLDNVVEQTNSAALTAPLFVVEQLKQPARFSMHPLLTSLKSFFEDPSIMKCAHNAKFDIQVLANYGISVQGDVFDTMIAASLVFPGERVGLKELALRHFNVEMQSYEELIADHKSIQQVELSSLATYAASDAFYTRKLQFYLTPLLKEKKLEALFYAIESPLVSVLAKIEFNGVFVNLEALNKLSELLMAQQLKNQSDIYSYSKESFNIKSTKQLADLLFDELALPVIKKTKTGRSTDVSVLEELQGQHPIIDVLLEYRKNEKLLNTYVNALPHLIHPKTLAIHTTYNQAVVITGRLSSSTPNLQNIPIRSDKGMAIRRVFIPKSTKRKLVALDYSQIELRLMAHFSKDQAMIDAFNAGQDIHKATASVIFDTPLDDISSEQRYQAKAVNFGIIYGISAFGLSKNLHISRPEAQQLIDDYFQQFPSIRLFIDSTIEQARQNKFVRTAFGRIRFLPNIKSKIFTRRQFEERAAVNTFLQGTAAEIMKLAMIAIDRQLHISQLDAQMVLQVHDELVFDVEQSKVDELVTLAQEIMETVVDYKIPLAVDVEVGDNWSFS